MTFRISALHHAQLTIPVGAEEEARAFYVHFLGIPEVPKPDALAGRGGFWLQLGAQQIHVGTEGNVDRRATKAHLAYEVQGLAALRSALESRGLEVKDSIPIPKADRFEARDPFGNRVEFLESL